VSRGRDLLAALALAAAAAGCAARPEIRHLPRGGGRASDVFEARPVPVGDRAALGEGAVDFERGARILALRVEPPGAGTGDPPAVAGAYAIAGDTIRFEPAFPLAEGVRYVAVFLPEAPGRVEREVLLPRSAGAPETVVDAVYPSADVLPENLLKFYLFFSAPMTRGQAWGHLRLLDGSGKAVELPFLEIDEELWDPGTKRLTVLIDPGRIKHGVRPLEEVGPSLVAGGSFVLEVLPAWEDAAGRPLREGHRKAFRVGPPDREPIDPLRWSITAPSVGGREPVVARLGEPLDHGLLQSALSVHAPGGRRLEGAIRIGDGESVWTFTPAAPWADGLHHIAVRTTLEDLSGNSVGRPFEVDALEPVRHRIEAGVVEVPFRPRGGAGEGGGEPAPAFGR
jgi:hypothetical protein